MAEDKGKILDSINQVDEEVSLEKAKAQESLNDPNVREEYFKQNIMMDVEEFPESVETAEEILQEKELEEVALQDGQTETENPQNIIIGNDESYEKHSFDEKSEAVEQQSSAIQNPENPSDNNAAVGEQVQGNVPADNVNNGTRGVSAFDQISVDQEIEEAVLFSDDSNSDENSPQTDTEDEDDGGESVNTAPDASDSSATASEDNVLIGQLIATDADDGDVLSFSLISNPSQGSVTVDPDGAYSFVPGDEFQDLAEGESRTVTFNYRVTDKAGASDTAEMSIVVTGNNDGPVAIALIDNNVDENSTGEVVGSLSTDDIDVNDSHTYTVDDSRFEVVNNGGGSVQLKLKDGVSLDHESSDTVNVIITSIDENGLSTLQEIEINVVDINEAPTNINLDALNIVIPTQEILLGDTGNGVVGQDGATGAGYIMYSEESVHTRFGNVHSQSADNFVSVKHLDGKWYYDTNTTYVEFTPDTSDRLVAEVDFGVDTVRLLSGINDPTYQIEGINAGYQSGELQITPNIWNGNTNYGEFRISGDSFLVVSGDEIASVDENSAGAIVGDLSTNDVDVNDTHTYTVNDSRFEVVDDGNGQMVLKLKDDVSLDHETETLIDVTVTATDSGGLSTTQDYSMNVANVNDMPVIEMLNGNVVSENAGNYVEGISIGSFGNGIVGQDGATGAGYIMYSEESVHTRFGNVHSQSADNFVAVKYIDGKWYYDTNSSYVEFTPDVSDRLVANVDFGADTVTLLSGINDPTYQIEGINAGYQNGDLQITPNVWGVPQHAPGEFGITGSQIFVSSASVVGTVSASDVDGDSLTYSLIDNADGRFGINSETGQVYVADGSKLDFESNRQHQITVEVADGNGGVDTESYIINVSDAKEFDISAVIDNDTDTNSINENASFGDTVGVTVFASDVDDSDSVTYSLTSNPNDAFAIDENTGEVTVADPNGLDFETAQIMQIEVTATSTDGSTSSGKFDISVTDVNEAPTDIRVTNANSNLIVDGDGSGLVNPGTWTHAQALGGWTASSGEVEAGSENIYISGGDSNNIVFEMDYAGAQDTIYQDIATADGQTYALSLDVAARKGTPLETNTIEVYFDGKLVDTIDPTSYNLETYTFEVAGTGDVARLEFREPAKDSNNLGGILDNISLSSIELSEATITQGSASEISVDENSSDGSIVAILGANDVDVSDTFTYEITSDPSGNFEVIGNEIRVKPGTDIDFESFTSHDITVQVTDSGGLIYSEVITINVNDQNEFDVSIVTDSDNATNNEVSESAVVGDTVGITALAQDQDAGDSVTYSLSSNPNNAFAIDVDTGEVTVADPNGLDFESAQNMQIEVTATSTDGSTSAQTFSIAITDDNSEFTINAVTDSDTALNSVNENAANGTTVGITALASDQDATDNVTYTLSDDAGGRFAIDAKSGEVSVADGSLLDYEAANSHNVTVLATSDDGSTSSETFTINVADVNENSAPIDIKFTGNDSLDISSNGSIGTAVVTGHIRNSGSNTSVDHWSITHNGGELTIDVLANGYNSGSLDSYVRVFRDNGNGSYTQVALNDDGSAGADGSSGSVDSYINQSNLSAGDYIVAISGYHLNASEAKATSDYPNRSSSTGPYQMTITGDTIVNGIATNPSGGGDWGNPQNDAVIVDSGDVLETIAAGSVVASVASVVDADGGDVHTFTLTDDAGGKFQIDPASGEISLAAEHDASNVYSNSVVVEVTDSSGETYTETVGIHLGTNSNTGVSGTINSSNYSQTGNGYTVTAKNVVGGAHTSASVDNVSVSSSALGADGTVSDTDSGRSNQIAYDKASGLSEEFIVDFDNDLSSADVSFMNLFTSSYGEVGHWAAYHDGALVAEGDFTETSSGSGTLNIDPGEAFNQIVMSANLQTDRSDGSDYQISGISYTEMPVDDEITGTSNDDLIYGLGGDDVLAGGDGNDIFIFDQGDGNDSINGGAGDGWVDSIDLSGYVKDAADPSNPWQIEVDDNVVDYDINAGLLELGDDVSGVIKFDDGSQLTFENIENIEW